MKILQDNKEHWKKVDDMRAIKSVQTRGLTNENINTINKPDLLNMSDTFRKNDVAVDLNIFEIDFIILLVFIFLIY